MKSNDFNFTSYEGNELMDGKINVIVSDGFGNVALKTAEGTINFITSN